MNFLESRATNSVESLVRNVCFPPQFKCLTATALSIRPMYSMDKSDFRRAVSQVNMRMIEKAPIRERPKCSLAR